MKYICDWDEKKTFVQVTFPVDWSANKYMDWKGYAEEPDYLSAVRHYGLNSFVYSYIIVFISTCV